MSCCGNSSSSSSAMIGATLPTMVSKWASLATQTRWLWALQHRMYCFKEGRLPGRWAVVELLFNSSSFPWC